ncbi:FAD-dependent oxidoreductase [Micromonospora maris]|uniref:FAD-binding oxidoreductase n=1 Tax=Micromonospora maris TaxID=1003110 RepID=UPI002E0E7834|nr:FAD-dependent oxidoreductase [Micromonospora maris]
MTTRLGTVPAGLTGKIVTEGDPRYALLRSTYTTVGRPAAVILAESADDVAAALRLARERNLPLAVRSGGHGLSGSATNDNGLVIDLSAMRRVDVLDRGTRLVRVEAGARWAQVAQALAPHALAISSGDHGNVGVGGLTTAGGIGWLVRHYGLTIDHVRAVEVVLPDGTQVRADAATEPDLLWVMRGAGAGAGIAVAFEIEAIELRDVGFAQLVMRVDAAGGNLQRWGAVMAAAPRALTTAVMLTSQGNTPVASITAVVASDKPATIQQALQPLLDIRGIAVQQAQVLPYPKLVPPAHLHPNTGQMPTHTTNGLFAGINREAARALVKAVTGRDPVLIQLRSLGGAANDLDPDATAYPHRHHKTLVIASTFPPYGRKALSTAWGAFAPHVDGAYVNFESHPDMTTFARAYPGPTGARVRELWKRYDPDGILHRSAKA